MAVQRAVITGGARGIGLAICLALAEDGYRVTLVDRHEGRAIEAAELLSARGHTVEPIVADLARDDDRERLLAQLSYLEDVSVLVLSAGAAWTSTLSDTPRKKLDLIMAVNFFAPYVLTQGLLPALGRAAERWGKATVVAVSSITASYGAPLLSAYAASKAALVSLCRTINLESGEKGVRASAICPAFVDTELSSWARADVPPQSMIPPEDIAEMARCLIRLSPNAVVPEVLMARARTSLTVA